MKVTISNKLAGKLKPILEDRKADPEVRQLLNQIDRARVRDQNLDLDELEAVIILILGSGNHTEELLVSARTKLEAMRQKILDGAGAVDQPRS